MISIIVPIYNAEQYLKYCLNSIKAQTYTNFEALLIVDGATDKSLEICNTYAANDSRFKVFYEDNAGPSTARNLGLKNAQGEFVTFIDSDDVVSSVYLFCLLSNIGPEDVCCFCKEAKIHQYDFPFNNQCNDVEVIPKAMCIKRLLTGDFYIRVHGALFRKSELQGLEFPSGIKHYEDKYFVFYYLLQSKFSLVRVLHNELYGQFERCDSLSHQSTYNSSRDIVAVADIILDDVLENHPGYKTEAVSSAVAARLSAIKYYLRAAEQDKYLDEIQKLRNEVLEMAPNIAKSPQMRFEILVLRIGLKPYQVLAGLYYKFVAKHRKIKY